MHRTEVVTGAEQQTFGSNVVAIVAAGVVVVVRDVGVAV